MKRLLFVLLVLSVVSLGMGKKPAEKPAETTAQQSVGLDQGNTPKAPDFKVKDLTGKDVTLSSYKDKQPVLLVFWATWCVYCRQEIPELIKLQEKYKGEGLVILSVNIKESTDKVKGFVEKNKITYPVLMDIEGKIANAYEVNGIPLNVLVDKKGNVIHYGSFDENLKKLIEKNTK